MGNVYFDLTRELNADGTIAILSSGQAVVWYRLAMMSKDGDWILQETEAACARVLEILGRRGARYRPSAPLAVRWLAGGWSSHLEFTDEKRRRVRCDFVSRPPRVGPAAIEALFSRRDWPGGLAVIDLPSLIATKQTQRAKDYPIIGALAGLLPPEQELAWSTDPDRVLALAAAHGGRLAREAVILARSGANREAVVVALAREADQRQRLDRERMERYERAAERYLAAFREQQVASLHLPEAHQRAVELAARLLPVEPAG